MTGTRVLESGKKIFRANGSTVRLIGKITGSGTYAFTAADHRFPNEKKSEENIDTYTHSVVERVRRKGTIFALS